MNAPGSDCGAGDPGLDSPGKAAGDPGLSAAADETGEDCIDLSPLDAGLENIRVNSPGADCAAGVWGLDSGTWEGGTGAGEAGLLAAGAGGGTDALDALGPIELNIRVNAPGAEDPACAGAAGLDSETLEDCADPPPLDAGLENIRVNSPGPDCAAGAPGLDSEAWTGGAGAGETGLPVVEIPTVGSSGGFSIATGLKTRATSFVRPISGAFDGAFEPARAPALGIVSACSMRVNSPGLRDVSGSAEGSGAGSFTGSTSTGTLGCAGGAATTGWGGSASAAFFSGVACPSNEASKSSSARGGAATCPKTPVALDG